MGDFILSVVMDVLRHIGIELRESCGVGSASRGGKSREFVVLDTAQLRVLQPQIGLDDLDRG
jgi:hypothetical protein